MYCFNSTNGCRLLTIFSQFLRLFVFSDPCRFYPDINASNIVKVKEPPNEQVDHANEMVEFLNKACANQNQMDVEDVAQGLVKKSVQVWRIHLRDQCL